MRELLKHKVAIIITAILIVVAIIAAAITPAAMHRVEVNKQFEIAMQYLNDLDYESAIIAFTKILEIDPKNKTVLDILQDTYLAYIRSEWEKGNTDHAIQIMSDMKNTLSVFGMTEDPYTAAVTVEPTCGTVGLETWTCNLNDDVLERDILATGEHIWDDGTVTTEATCAAEGVMTYYCIRCDAEMTDIIDKNNTHTYDSGKITKEATCTEDGERTLTCVVCKETQKQTITATGKHIWEEEGYIGTAISKELTYYSCGRCGARKTEGAVQVLVDDVTIVDEKVVISGYHLSYFIQPWELWIDGCCNTGIVPANAIIADEKDELNGFVKDYVYFDIDPSTNR